MLPGARSHLLCHTRKSCAPSLRPSLLSCHRRARVVTFATETPCGFLSSVLFVVGAVARGRQLRPCIPSANNSRFCGWKRFSVFLPRSRVYGNKKKGNKSRVISLRFRHSTYVHHRSTRIRAARFDPRISSQSLARQPLPLVVNPVRVGTVCYTT